MKLLKTNLPLFVIILLVYGCIPKHLDPTRNGSEIPIKDLKVSENFEFKSTRDIKLSVKVANPNFPGERFRINVYNDLPTVGQLLVSGLTAADQSLTLEFRIPAPLKELHIEKINANGASEVKKIKADDYASADFKTATPILALRKQANSGLDCVTGVTKSYTNHKNNLTINGGEIISLKGTYSGTITMKGGELRICGNPTDLKINMNNNDCKVYFLEGSVVGIDDITGNTPSAKVYNYSEALTLEDKISMGGSFENHGKMVVNGDFTVSNNNTNTFVNNGELHVKGTFSNNRHFVNNNVMTVDDKYQANGSSLNENNCKLYVKDEFKTNNNFINRGYIQVSNDTDISGSSSLTLMDGAMLSTKNISLNGTISGSGSKSIVKVSGQSKLTGSANMTGSITLCDENGLDQNSSKISSAFFSCGGTYLAKTSCNPEGFGTAPDPTTTDNDKDGISNVMDDYPNDPTRAYNSYYPSASGWATYGFEDLWPGTGDYDFNDLVINSRVTRVFNADNKLVELKNQIVIKAIGAAFENGFGFQLDGVNSNEVASVTGYSHTKGYVQLAANKTEAGQPKAVIVAFDSPEPLIKRTSGSMFNTVKENPVGTTNALEVVVKFATPLDAAKASQEKINPFIIVNGKREVEVHLANYAPTAKANVSLFGTLKDDSKPASSRYYRTSSNLPWAIEIPVEFNYPIETAPITDAYLYFSDWAKSGGSQRTDWYEDKPGNKNQAKTFH
ncbi:LruC domain-containing protein [Telluribacter sp.]|jgi:LruC domain-containing protein|uniref:LruC domain-containing protein n=1 Tax=Telluribacter sp. TaxID=1978767 RepID=UPI002E1420E2|nr:LruC domain-containing protein [Telluribacter sp.]